MAGFQLWIFLPPCCGSTAGLPQHGGSTAAARPAGDVVAWGGVRGSAIRGSHPFPGPSSWRPGLLLSPNLSGAPSPWRPGLESLRIGHTAHFPPRGSLYLTIGVVRPVLACCGALSSSGLPGAADISPPGVSGSRMLVSSSSTLTAVCPGFRLEGEDPRICGVCIPSIRRCAPVSGRSPHLRGLHGGGCEADRECDDRSTGRSPRLRG